MKIHLRETKREGFIQITTLDERWYLRQEDSKLFISNTWVCQYAPKGIGFYKWLASMGWDEAQAVKEAAGEKGSRVHKALEIMFEHIKATGHAQIGMNDIFPDNADEPQYKELTPDEYWCVITAADWWNEYSPVEDPAKIISVEMTHYNEEIGYACTLDLHCCRGDLHEIVDFKTGQGVYLDHEIQLAGIGHCDDLLPLNPGLKIVQLGYRKNKRGWKETNVVDKWNLWLAAHEFWMEENADKQPYQREYPNPIIV